MAATYLERSTGPDTTAMKTLIYHRLDLLVVDKFEELKADIEGRTGLPSATSGSTNSTCVKAVPTCA